MPDQVIEELKTREDESGRIDLGSIADRLKPGQNVRVMDGDLEGLGGIFQSKSGEDRAIILLDMLRRKVKTTVPVDAIEAL